MKQLIAVISLATSLFPRPVGAAVEEPASASQDHVGMDVSDRLSASTTTPDPGMNTDPTAAAENAGMQMRPMSGMYGPYSMTREASGTSWQPDASSIEGIHHMGEEWMTMVHGYVNGIYDHQGGPRGASKTFSESMLMLMAQRPLGPGTWGLRGMFSLDPLMGKPGYPELFQTGETADGQNPLIDRQHPHDLVMELATSYSVPVSGDSAVFIYGGLPGEPALGPPTFMHRLSGMDNPEAPIAHHWLDSTHVTFGVLTLGYIHNDFKLEVSVFRGREPDQFRYNIETGTLDSVSARLSFNPTAEWALQASYGHIKSPEQLEPEVNINRTTASAIYSSTLDGNDWQTTFAWGRNAPSNRPATDAFLLESALKIADRHTIFGRFERVEKDELFVVASPLGGQAFQVNKLSVGYVYDLPTRSHIAPGIGGLVSSYSFPAALNETYGNHPVSFMLFGRLKIQ